jgi:hypothetical protein
MANEQIEVIKITEILGVKNIMNVMLADVLLQNIIKKINACVNQHFVLVASGINSYSVECKNAIKVKVKNLIENNKNISITFIDDEELNSFCQDLRKKELPAALKIAKEKKEKSIKLARYLASE